MLRPVAAIQADTFIAATTMAAEKSESRYAVEPVSSGDGASTPLVRSDDLRLAFGRLMAGYGGALGGAEQVDPVYGEDIDPALEISGPVAPLFRMMLGSRGPLFGPLVRLLTGSHVRRQLSALAARCAQLAAAADPKREGELRSLLDEVRERAEQTASFLPSPRRPSVFVFVPFTIALAAPLGSLVVTRNVPDYLWLLALIVLLLIASMVYVELAAAYLEKRELFLPGATEVDRQPRDEQSRHTGQNSYRDEIELFTLLGSGRRREAELDRTAAFFGTFVLFYGGLIVAIALLGSWLRWGVFVLCLVLSYRVSRALIRPPRFWR